MGACSEGCIGKQVGRWVKEMVKEVGEGGGWRMN
ncbi:hypothetical protein HNQ69_001443 [Bartonella callosciuri]|uniref:Uncharacterized protein n=1 Tax=Bartonella callosciuri TaxID=686223 RepID=A0A840NWI4_9HYPH|nr:hypothetical protein [Bartonella callosciuri]